MSAAPTDWSQALQVGPGRLAGWWAARTASGGQQRHHRAPLVSGGGQSGTSGGREAGLRERASPNLRQGLRDPNPYQGS